MGAAICLGIAACAARALFDAKYCSKIIHRVYKYSDQPTEKVRLRNARIAATVVLVMSTYYFFRDFVF